MGQPVATGALLTCSFGVSPSSLMVLPDKRTITESRPVATIFDNRPLVNIPPFGVCMSLANPVTASLTAAALGVLTPGPCLPVTTAPWAPGSPTVLIGGQPALTGQSLCFCAYGGVITVSFPATVRETLP